MPDNPAIKPTDYGIIKPDACDPGLRKRVIEALNPKDSGGRLAGEEDIAEVATYINQLEDALLRYHWGNMTHHEVLELLKCTTGLDIEARSQEINAMAAVDA